MDFSEKKKSILVVEDDEMVLDLVAQGLRFKYPCAEIHTANNGNTGLDRYMDLLPHIVITDVGLPGMDGIEMARRILEQDQGVQIIVISAFGEKTVKQKTEYAGIQIQHCLCKPLDYGELFGVLDGMLGLQKPSLA